MAGLQSSRDIAILLSCLDVTEDIGSLIDLGTTASLEIMSATGCDGER
jgi:hypothetical protein